MLDLITEAAREGFAVEFREPGVGPGLVLTLRYVQPTRVPRREWVTTIYEDEDPHEVLGLLLLDADHYLKGFQTPERVR